jgi:hypothetical protein
MIPLLRSYFSRAKPKLSGTAYVLEKRDSVHEHERYRKVAFLR